MSLQSAALSTDATGKSTAAVRIAGAVAGTTPTVTACAWETVCTSWQVNVVVPVRSVSLSQASAFVFSQIAASWNLALTAVQDGAPAAYVPVSWSAAGGVTVQATTGSTGLSGQAATVVTIAGMAVGAVGTVTACAWTTVCATWQVTAVDAGRAVVMANPPSFLAAGAAASWNLSLTAVQQGQPAPGVQVVWSSTGELALQGTVSTTGTTGQATVTATTNGLVGGTTATVTGCVWVTVCTTWQVVVVDSAQWTIAVAAGAGQSATVGSALAGVTFTVTDGAGYAVQGAPVILYQTVDGWEGVCPEQGRCASAPVLAATTTSFTTDSGGLLAVAPMQVPGVPQMVNLAAVTGTTGFVTLSLPIAP